MKLIKKLQLIGGSQLVVIPSAWIKMNGLKEKSKVILEVGNDVILIKPEA